MAVLNYNFFMLWILVIFITITQCEEIATKDSGLASKTIVIKEDESISSSNSALHKSVVPFYNLTNKFLSFIQPLAAEGELEIVKVFNIISGDNGTNIDFTKVQKHWLKVLKRYLGYVVLLAIGLLFIIVMPFAGLIFCFCRCCGHCGGYVKPMERKRARCRRVVNACILGSLATVMLAGVVVMFITNDLLHKSLVSKNGGVAPVLNESLNKSANFFLTLSNKVSEKVDSKIKAISSQVEAKVIESLDVMTKSFLNATGITKNVLDVNQTISDLKYLTLALNFIKSKKVEFERLHNDLKNDAEFNQIKTEILRILGTQQQGEFIDIDSSLYENTKLSVEHLLISQNLDQIQFTEVATILKSDIITWLNSSMVSLEANLSLTGQVINNVASIADAVDKERQALKNALNDPSMATTFVRQVQNVLNQFANCFTRLGVSLNNAQVSTPASSANVVPLQNALQELDLYRVYGFIGLGCICLLVIFFFYLGLCFGFCGEPPYEDAGLCNRGVGANFLMAGVAFSFLFSWLIMLITIIMFFTGGPMYTEACRYLINDTASSQIDGHIILDKALVRFNKALWSSPAQRSSWTTSELFVAELPDNLVSGVLNECQREDSSLVRIFKLDKLVDVSSIAYSSNSKIDELTNNLRSNSELLTKNLTSVIEYLMEDLKVAEQRLVNVSQVSFQRSINELSVVLASWENVKINVEQIIKLLPPSAESIKIRLKQLLSNLTSKVVKVTEMSLQLKAEFKKLNSSSSVKEVRNEMIKSYKILADPASQLNQATEAVSKHLKRSVNDLIREAIKNMFSGVDSCRNLSLAMHRILNFMCKDVLNNFNCLWCGLGCFVILLVPSIIVAVKLNNLYRKIEKYMKDYEEPDYMAYQGFYPGDNIPLERCNDFVNRHGKPVKRTDSSSRGGSGVGGSSSGATSAANRNKSNYKPLPSYPYQDSYE